MCKIYDVFSLGFPLRVPYQPPFPILSLEKKRKAHSRQVLLSERKKRTTSIFPFSTNLIGLSNKNLQVCFPFRHQAVRAQSPRRVIFVCIWAQSQGVFIRVLICRSWLVNTTQATPNYSINPIKVHPLRCFRFQY